MLRLGGSRVSGTGPEERGRLSDPHQIAVRAIYKIPPTTSIAPNTIKNILASSIHRCHASEAAQALTAFCAVNSHRRGRSWFRRFNSAGFSPGFEESAHRFTLHFEPMLLERGGLLRLRKSGGPALLEPSFQVERDRTHAQNSGLSPRSQRR
jgi:hypothetical protein